MHTHERLVLLARGVAAGLALALTTSAFALGGGWRTAMPVPSVGGGVEGAGIAAVGNRIIVAQGLDSGLGDTDLTRIYDISSNTWSMGSLAPGANSEGAGVAHGGLLYTIGGRGPLGARAEIWSYDLTTDTWDPTLTPMPTPRAGLAVAVVGNAIYAIGGRSGTGGPNSFGKLDVVERYDIASDTWTTVAPLPMPRSDLAAATVGGKVYVFGGFDLNGLLLGDVDVYDPHRDRWSAAPADMPTPRAAFYAVADQGGTVFCIGGWDGVFPFDPVIASTVEAYKVSRDQWQVGLPPMPTPRAEAGAISHGGRIWVLGGAQPGFGASVSANEVFKIHP